jgi:ribonuclease P protein component
LQQAALYNLPIQQKLKSKKQIDALFANGKSFLVFPIKIMYCILPEGKSIQIGVTANKRNFKKAVDRNRIKRLLREAFRKQKHIILPSTESFAIHVFFVFIDKALPSQQLIDEKMKVALQKLLKQLPQENELDAQNN